MRSSLARALGAASPVSVLASNCTPLRFVSFSHCVSAMARPVLGPAWAMPFRAMPARRTMQTLFATAGSVSDPMQPVQPAVGSADKSTRKVRSLSRKSAPVQPVAAPASDTKKAALKDDKQSTEAAQKQAAIAETLKRIAKDMGPNMIMAMDAKQQAEDIERISTGCLTLDSVLGGGIARGRVAEIFGPESCGKTSLAVCIMAEAQKQYPSDNVVLMDLESSFDMAYGMRLGLKKTNCYIGTPNSGDQALKICEQLIASGGVSVVVIDSVSALMPESELDRDFGDPQVGSQARLLSTGLRRLSRIAGQYNVSLIFINQLRMKIGVIYGNPETTSGGMALRFYASQRIDVRRKEMLTGPSALKEAPANGIRIRAKVVKNKTAPPGGEALFDLLYDRGIDKVSSTVDGAVMADVVEKRASYYYYHEADGREVLLGQGKHNAVKTLELDPELLEKIHTEALKRLQDANRGRVVGPEDASSDEESVAGTA